MPAPFPPEYPEVVRRPLPIGPKGRVRAEGRTLGESVRHALSYLRKNNSPLYQASLDEAEYFDRVRPLTRAMQRRPNRPAESATASIAFCGDLMWMRRNWAGFVSPEVLDWLNEFPAVVANLESPISALHGVPRIMPDYLTFNSPPELVTNFRRPDGSSTFTALTTCNNHTLDRGEDGFRSTLEFLDRERIPHVGVRRSSAESNWLMFERQGVKYGLYAACWGLNNSDLMRGVNLELEVVPGIVPDAVEPFDLSRMETAFAEMHEAGVEVKVAALHWGFEFEFYPDPGIVRLARRVVEAGADVVIGTHPHVVQPVELIGVNGYETSPAPAYSTRDPFGRKRLAVVAYSLGNFATAMFTPHCRTGLVLGLDLERDADGVNVAGLRMRLIHTLPTPRGPLLWWADELGKRPDAGELYMRRLSGMAGVVGRHLLGSRR